MSLEADTHFNLLLLRQSNVDESIVISPLSLALALAMVNCGAEGKSNEEIRQVIAGGASDEKLLNYFKSLSEALLKKSDVKVKLANRIYIRERYNLRKTYLDKIKKHFDAKAVNLDFSKGEKCSKIVNGFVEEATVGKIKSIVQPADFEDATFILLNAIYFEGEWQCRFWPCRPIDFHLKKGVIKQIPSMYLESVSHEYVETDEAQVVSISYKDTNFKFMIILPKQKFGLADVRKNLTAEKLLGLMGRFHYHRMHITIPKFKIEKMTPLVNVLKTMGIKEIFTDSANLDGIAKDVHISEARQKAFIEVDEIGTKAAAVTEKYEKEVKDSEEEKMTYFNADHPFLFFLTYKKNIVFCGQYNG